MILNGDIDEAKEIVMNGPLKSAAAAQQQTWWNPWPLRNEWTDGDEREEKRKKNVGQLEGTAAR